MGFPGGTSSRAERFVQDPSAAAYEIQELVRDRLMGVEALFREHLASPVGIIDEIGDFLATGGGKRIRPTLHLLCARLCDYRGTHDVLLATVLEFIHSATLIHDDIIDDAKTRRGRPSVNHRWGNNVTVLFGDWLYAKAMDMALEAESLEIMSRLADITLRMTEGEMIQTRLVGRIDLTVAEHLDLVERKTAVLFGGCCELAAILARADRETTHALRRFGLNLGLAFQIVDDLLDFTGDAAVLGKPAASDLSEGKVTLALIDLLSTGSVRGLALTRRVIEAGRSEGPAIEELTALLHSSGAIARTRARARGYAAAAVAELGRFPDSAPRRALENIPELLLDRDR